MSAAEEILSGPYHDFWLLHGEPRDAAELWGRKDAPVRLSDDLVSYLWDTLQWVPTLNPSHSPHLQGSGLNRWGATAVAGDGARMLAQLARRWAALFELAPGPTIRLTGSFQFQLGDDGQPAGEGGYVVLLADRDRLVGQLGMLAQMADQASQGDHFLLHLGV